MKPVTRDVSISRRDFLRGNIHAKKRVLRPPWAVKSVLFYERCTGCADCVDACPENILQRDPDGYPAVHFSQAGCTFCAECLETCETGALQGLRSDTDQAWRHTMQISERCLSIGGVVCRACGDHCEVRAIRFTQLTQGRLLPEINAATCTGCGQCIAACPADAITITDKPEIA